MTPEQIRQISLPPVPAPQSSKAEQYLITRVMGTFEVLAEERPSILAAVRWPLAGVGTLAQGKRTRTVLAPGVYLLSSPLTRAQEWEGPTRGRERPAHGRPTGAQDPPRSRGCAPGPIPYPNGCSRPLRGTPWATARFAITSHLLPRTDRRAVNALDDAPAAPIRNPGATDGTRDSASARDDKPTGQCAGSGTGASWSPPSPWLVG